MRDEENIFKAGCSTKRSSPFRSFILPNRAASYKGTHVMANLTFTPPADGAAVTMQNDRLCVPDRPVIPFIIGDGTGPEIWAAASRVIDAAVAKAYQGRRSIAWYEVFAGQKSFDNLGTWLPNETVEAFRTYLIGIKGPLTTPVGGGIPQPERHAAAGSGSVCLPASRALFQRH